jgi:hypothetical protein
MPPRKHYSKSQEFVYKKVGSGSLGGSRQKYKLVARELPSNVASGSSADAAAAPQLPRVVSALSIDEGSSFPDTSSGYFDDILESRSKKSGKVC